MDVRTTAKLADEIATIGLSPKAFGARVVYLASGDSRDPRDRVSMDTISDVLPASRKLVKTVLKRFERADALSQTDSDGVYAIEYDTWHRLIDRTQWLSDENNQRQLEPVLDEVPAVAEIITSSPSDIDEIPYSSITGQMVEIIAGSEERVTVVNPFFTRDGLDLVVDSFVAATERGIQFELITRDILLGDRSNKPEMETLISRVRKDGNIANFDLLEIDSENFSDATLHAKLIIVDQRKAYIGSANLTDQSLQNAVEMGLYLEGPPVDQIVSYVSKCRQSYLFVPVSFNDI